MFKRWAASASGYRFRRRVIVALGRGRGASDRGVSDRGLRVRTELVIALLIFAVSFAIKSLQATDVAFLLNRPDQRVTSQQATFHTRAISIVKAGGLLMPKRLDPADTGLLGYAPGYPIFLAAVYSTSGIDFSTAQAIQNGVNSISPILIFLIAGLLVKWRAAAMAGFLAAVSNHLSYYSNFLMADALAPLPLLLAIYILIRLARKPRSAFWLYALAGATLSLSVWIRQNGLLLAPFLAFALASLSAAPRQATRRLAVMTTVFYLAIAPITIRNYLIYGEFVPVGISATHIEFRYALAMHYFLFIFAAVAWVLTGSFAFDGAKRLGVLIRKNERKSYEAI
jgi:hypothetical protein